MKPFHLGAASGVIAATTTGVIFAWRNPGVNVQYIQRLRFELAGIVQPTNAQELALALFFQSTFTANYTGGTACGLAGRARKFDGQRILASAALATSQLADANVRIADTGALSAGGGDVIDAQPWSRRGVHVPATALDRVDTLVLEWKNPAQGVDHEDEKHGCLILPADTGFNVSLPVALGAAFTARLSAEIDWVE